MSSTKLPSPWWLFRQTLASYRPRWWRYSVIVAIVSTPVTIVNLVPSLSSEASLVAYLSLASLIMNVALLWAVTQPDFATRPDWLSSSYYDSSVALLRFVLVALVLALCLLPGVLGLSIYGMSLGDSLAAPSLGESLILGLLAAMAALPSLWLGVRLGFALIWVMILPVRPVAALRLSWQLTRRRFWQALVRMMAVVILIVITLALPSAVLLGLAAVTHIKAFVIIFQIMASIVALPLISVLAFEVYQSLGGKTVNDQS